jgi:acyl dehydratase
VVSERKTTIFLAGAGRSGFVAKSFAMRLMHLGFYVYVFNETIAPPVRDGDIIIIISKSGKSNSITQIVEDSKIDNVKFKRPVVPGDTLVIKLRVTAPLRRTFVEMDGEVYVGNTLVSSASMMAQVIKNKNN